MITETILIILSIILVIREYFFYHIFYRKQKGIDSSNRFNKERLIWFSLTRTYLFHEKMLELYGAITKWTKVKLFFDVLRNEEKFSGLFWWTQHDEHEMLELAVQESNDQ